MPIHQIQSLDDSRLDVYRNLRKTNQNRHQDLCIAEGVTVVERLFCSDCEIHSVLVTDRKMEAFRATIPHDVDVYAVTKELSTMLVGYTFHMGVLAAGYRQPPPEPSSVLPDAGSSLVMFADRVIDQQNIGLLIRIASGFGADALVVANGSADPFSRRAIRVSMGNGLTLPIIRSDKPGADILRELKGLSYSVCGTVLSDAAKHLGDFEFPERTVLAFGNETHGLCDSVIDECDHQLMISMMHDTDSLNVAISAGIFSHAYRAAISPRA